jgi:hypothetical protein
MRKAKRRLIVTAIIVLLLLVLIGLWTFYDAPPPDDADLRLPYLAIPEQENGFTYFSAAGEEMIWPDRQESDTWDAILDGETWDAEFAAAFLARNGRWNELIAQGLACARCQVPELRRLNDVQSYLADWRRAARLSSVRALYLMRTGREKEAFDECLQTVRFGRRIQDCRGGLSTYLVGIAVERMATERLRALLSETDLRGEQLREYVERLDDGSSHASGLANAYRIDYVIWCRMLDDLAAGRPLIPEDRARRYGLWERLKRRFILKPNRTKRLIADFARHLIAQVGKPYVEIEPAELPMPEEMTPLRLLLCGNGGGLTAIWLFEQAWHYALAVKCRAESSIAATRILIALRCYKLEHGELPETLEALVPEYFEAVPLDDFDGKPMKYSRDKHVVYAVGTDLTDNGGIAENDREDALPADGYDLIYKIEF